MDADNRTAMPSRDAHFQQMLLRHNTYYTYTIIRIIIIEKITINSQGSCYAHPNKTTINTLADHFALIFS